MSFLKKIKGLYLHNAIVQFIVSYICVLLLPLIICSIGISISFQFVHEDLKKSNMDMLSHNIEMIDSDMKAIQTTALQIARNKKVLKVASHQDSLDADFYLMGKEAINEVRTIMTYKSGSLLENLTVYYGNSNYVQNNNTLYEIDFFYKYNIDPMQQTKEQWLQYVMSTEISDSYFSSRPDGLEWVNPMFRVDGGKLPGSVICKINMNTFNGYFSPLSDENGAEFYLKDQDGSILYNVNTSNGETDLSGMMLAGKEGFVNYGDKLVIYNSSSENGLQYILIIPEKQVMYKLNDLKRTNYLLIFLASGIGLFIACYMSFRNGKPINEIFNIYLGEEEIAADFRDFGGVVTKILGDNKELLQEIEQEKPFIQSAFLNKLIHGNVVNEDELLLLLDKIDSDIMADSYIVIAFKIFANNDYYDIDLQTMEEVRVISHYIQNIMREYLDGAIWFSDADYLTNLAIIPGKTLPEEGKEIALHVQSVISNQYQVFPCWGISNPCTDLLDIWRACEEAKEALERTEGAQRNQVVLYENIIGYQKEIYYPKTFEEKLVQSVLAGDMEQVKILLSMSYKENFELRHIPRNKFLKLNRRFSETVTSVSKSEKALGAVEELSGFVLNYPSRPIDEYYGLLTNSFEMLCSELQQKKLGRRQVLTGQMTEYINAHYMNSNLGLSMLATEFGISEGYVSTLFKEQIGTNFADYVEKLRIDRACVLLKESSDSISSIAEQVGYNSIQSFRRAFKKVIGKSPRDLRTL